MNLAYTSVALGFCILVLGLAVLLDRRPYRPGQRRYIMLMIVALAGVLVLGRHLATLIL